MTFSQKNRPIGLIFRIIVSFAEALKRRRHIVLTKAERTRQFIIEQAAPIFNRKGFAGTSMSDILHATGLAKGGLYGNFESKEEIAREAFKYMFDRVYTDMVKTVIKKQSPLEKLIAVCDYHKDYTKRTQVDGGCPILNFSIEVDDT